MNFYVYQYLRSVSSEHGPAGTPYYIGKGRGKRAYYRGPRDIPKPKDRANVVVVLDDLLEAEALLLERQLIRAFGRIGKGTGCLRNRTDGGEANAGAIRTAEHKAKIAAVHRGLRHTDKAKAKMSASRTGIKRSEETKAKIGAAQRGRIVGPMAEEQKAKISAATKGRPKSDEFKAKISEANRRRALSEKSRKKIAQSLMGRKHTEESRAKMSATRKGRVPHNKGKAHREDTKERMSAAQKAVWARRHEFDKKSDADVKQFV